MDTYIYGDAEPVAVGNTVVLSAGTLTTDDNFAGAPPSGGSFQTFVVDNSANRLDAVDGVSVAPEPGTWALLGLGAGLLGLTLRRRAARMQAAKPSSGPPDCLSGPTPCWLGYATVAAATAALGHAPTTEASVDVFLVNETFDAPVNSSVGKSFSLGTGRAFFGVSQVHTSRERRPTPSVKTITRKIRRHVSSRDFGKPEGTLSANNDEMHGQSIFILNRVRRARPAFRFWDVRFPAMGRTNRASSENLYCKCLND